MTITEPLGLRERKRIETRAQLERAAVDIATRDGLEHATVEALSAAANVSPRTFFNYFDSKEDAILGVRDTPITDEMVAAHIESHPGVDIVESVVRLLFTVFNPALADAALHQARIELVRRYPHLMARQVIQVTRMGEQLTAAITQLLHHDEPNATVAPTDATSSADPVSDSPRDHESEAAMAEMLLTLCSGAFRIAIKQWMASGGVDTREELENRAITLVREVEERIK